MNFSHALLQSIKNIDIIKQKQKQDRIDKKKQVVQSVQRIEKSIYTAVLVEVVGRGDYDDTMNHWPKAEKDSSSEPEIAIHQSRRKQNPASMRFNSFTQNKPTPPQPFLGGEGYSQRNFAATM